MEDQGNTGQGEPMQRALLLDNDLFFTVKVRDTLKHVGYETRAVRRLADFERGLADDTPTVALVNTAARGIDWQAGIAAARSAGVPVVAFGSHVDVETQEQARAAGATSVIANSKLAADLPGVVARALRRSTAQSAATNTQTQGQPGVTAGDDAETNEVEESPQSNTRSEAP